MALKYTHECKGSESCHTKNHLCQIIVQRDLGRIKELVRDARYYCKNCGRAAHDMNNLCNPSKI
ncbi:MAG: hypothetical protein PHW14_01390 [Candidatus Omnitrophica bacterium]|jgi:hypothetical protein|nr:hypothetical protein [Candidatus Omnitrophota bacterium]